VDPTKNVRELVEAAIARQDDLRQSEAAHIREILELRAEFAKELRATDMNRRDAETARIDAIRAVDVAAVQQAATVASTQATTLAGQVAAAAEAMRTQVAATTTSFAAALTAAIAPINDAIADLRRAQYEQQGMKAQTSDTRLNFGAMIGAFGVLVAFAALIYAAVKP